MNNRTDQDQDLIRELEEALRQLNEWETVETTSGLPDVDFNLPDVNPFDPPSSSSASGLTDVDVNLPDVNPLDPPSSSSASGLTDVDVTLPDVNPLDPPSSSSASGLTDVDVNLPDGNPLDPPSSSANVATKIPDTTEEITSSSQDTTPDPAPLCCECSAGAALRCPQCNLDYCKACSDGAHRFVAMAGHSPAPLEEATVVFSVEPLPPIEEVLPARSPSKYFSVDKLLAFQQGSLHAVRRPGRGLPYPDFTQYHLLYDFFYSEVDAEGFKCLKNQVGRMVQTCRSREDVTCLLQFILDTLLERKRGLSARVRIKCVELRDAPQSSMKRDRKAEGSFHRVLRANQLFVHALFALVKDEVTTRGNLQRDYLIEDVAEILLMSRHLFYPHKAIQRTSSSG